MLGACFTPVNATLSGLASCGKAISSFLAKEFNRIGVEIAQITAISDQKNVIIDALDQARKRADIIIITGGLGPTKDDLTKHTLCEYFNDQLVKNEAVLMHIENIFKNVILILFLSTAILSFASYKSLGEKSYTGVMASTGLSYLSLIVSLGASGGLLLLA